MNYPSLFDTDTPSKPVANTKGASYTKTQESAGTARKRVLDAISEHGPLSMRLIEEHTGLLRSSVCGRLDELTKAGLVYKLDKAVYDTKTERFVKQYGVVIQANSNA